jgi:hypothetical protein
MYLFHGIDALESGEIGEDDMLAINHEVWGTRAGNVRPGK